MILLVHFVTAAVFFLLWRSFSKSEAVKYVIKGSSLAPWNLVKLTLLLLVIPFALAESVSVAFNLSMPGEPGSRWGFIRVLFHLLNLLISRSQTKARLGRLPR